MKKPYVMKYLLLILFKCCLPLKLYFELSTKKLRQKVELLPNKVIRTLQMVEFLP